MSCVQIAVRLTAVAALVAAVLAIQNIFAIGGGVRTSSLAPERKRSAWKLVYASRPNASTMAVFNSGCGQWIARASTPIPSSHA